MELRGISGKGIGVFAKKSIDRGTIFGYGGVQVSRDYFIAQQKKSNRIIYVISLTSGAYIDAHPSCGQNNVLWIGSKVNEPSDGEAFNCVLMCVLYKREEMYQREINILVVLLL